MNTGTGHLDAKIVIIFTQFAFHELSNTGTAQVLRFLSTVSKHGETKILI